MTEQRASRRLHLVKPPERTLLQKADVTITPPSAQGVLFPAPKPGTVVFVYMSEATEWEFRDALTLAQPRLVVELRRTPWLDIGQMDRHQVFECFDRVQAQYVDFGLSEGSGSATESLRARLAEVLRERAATAERPLMFLLASKAIDQDLPQQVVSALSAAHQTKAEVHEVPSFAPPR